MINKKEEDSVFYRAIDILKKKNHDIYHYIVDYERYGSILINPNELLKYAENADYISLEYNENKK